MSVTIYDVARKAGVGIATVSRTINNSTQVSPQTKAKVQKAIRDLKYQPHALAQGLARKKTNMIAIVVPFFTGYFYHELLKGVQEEISKHKNDLILYSLDQTDKTEIILKRTLEEKRVDGVLLISLSISDAYAREFQSIKLPIVLVDSYHPNLDSIYVENERGAYTATEYLIKLGHTKVGMIDGQLRSMPAKIRLDGYKKALADHRIPFHSEYFVVSEPVSDTDGFNRESGYNGMKRLLRMEEERPTAVFVSSDIQAAGAIKAIQEQNLRIPDDVAIIGFDDIELAEYLELTTMRQPMVEMGKLGVQRLMARIAGEAEGIYQRVLTTELIIRKTCGPVKGAVG